MDVTTIEKSFTTFLEERWVQSGINQFLLVYIRLLLLFEINLPARTLAVILERQKQLRGEPYDSSDFENLRSFGHAELSRHLKTNKASKEATLNRLMFASLLDTDETDSFYLSEPIFEFVREMKVSPVDLMRILELEFVSFKVDR
jgi:hypothetical protein